MQKLVILTRRVLRARVLSRTEWRLVFEALAALAQARLMLARLPFPRAMARLGLRIGGPETAVADTEIGKAVAVAVRRAASIAPFRAVCLQQAVAAALLLRRRGQPVEVLFGVARHDTRLDAHAWAISGAVTVTGGAQRHRFTQIAVFAP